MADEVEEGEQESFTQEEDRQNRLTQFPQTRVRNMMKQDPDLQLLTRKLCMSSLKRRYDTVLNLISFLVILGLYSVIARVQLYKDYEYDIA